MKSYSIFIIGNLYILYTINQKNNNNPDPVKPGMTGKVMANHWFKRENPLRKFSFLKLQSRNLF